MQLIWYCFRFGSHSLFHGSLLQYLQTTTHFVFVVVLGGLCSSSSSSSSTIWILSQWQNAVDVGYYFFTNRIMIPVYMLFGRKWKWNSILMMRMMQICIFFDFSHTHTQNSVQPIYEKTKQLNRSHSESLVLCLYTLEENKEGGGRGENGWIDFCVAISWHVLHEPRSQSFVLFLLWNVIQLSNIPHQI